MQPEDHGKDKFKDAMRKVIAMKKIKMFEPK